ncbi:MAG TPA: tripartite tricarboxylate transporter substrate binding protein [Xanthobacteraceae bacterium]|nr:tripartite tricarboxylate transporter substrate binding protein [Xanthobacteraceae bacterium]
MTRTAAIVVLTGVLVLPMAAAADEWPSRPVRMVNTFAAGGTADVLTRLMADHFSSVFKQQFFVETRAGAAGTIGVKSVVDSPPDGYNFVLTNITHLALAPITNPRLGYDPFRDLTNIGYIAGSPIVFSVNAKSGIKTIKDFVAWAKRSDRPLTYSSSGVGSSGHLVAETFALQAGIKIEHVPYKGASQGLADLVGGHIAFSAQTVSSTAGLVRGGTLVALAHTGKERLPDFPDLPTLKDSGYDLVATTWFTLSGPARLPPAIVQKVNEEMRRAVNKPEMQQRFRQDGLLADPMTVEELKKFIESEQKRWRPALERAGLIGKAS